MMATTMYTGNIWRCADGCGSLIRQYWPTHCNHCGKTSLTLQDGTLPAGFGKTKRELNSEHQRELYKDRKALKIREVLGDK